MKYLIFLLFPLSAHAINIDFYRNGIPETVSVDTGTPANTLAMPVGYFNTSGVQTNIATEATLLSANQNLADILLDTADIEIAVEAINTKTPALGQAAMAGSVPVAIATDQSAIPVSQSGTWNINNISGTISLPTGAATEATLSTLNAKVVTVDTGAVTISTALPAGNNNIGDVDVASLPSIPAGNNNIGDVDVASLPVAFDAGNSSATTQRVVIATDQAAVATKAPVNTSGSQTDATLTATTAATATAPANAVGFILQAPDTNTDNIRWRVGATASTTAGMQLQPGRDSGFVPVAANVSICAEVSGTNAYQIQWVLSQ